MDGFTTDAIVLLSLLMLPIATFFVWRAYLRALALARTETVLLAVTPPESGTVLDTSAISGIVLSLHQTAGPRGWYARYIAWRVMPWFSLEIVAENGLVRFFIWTDKRFRTAVENAVRMHAGTLSVAVADDYAAALAHGPRQSAFALYGVEYGNREFIPASATDAERAKNEIADDAPETLLDVLRTHDRGEHIWLQIIVRGTPARGGDDLLFETGIRLVYIAEKSVFRPTRTSHFARAVESLCAARGIRVVPFRTSDPHPYQCVMSSRASRAGKFYAAYVQRGYFYAPHAHRASLFSQKDIARMFPLARANKTGIAPAARRPSARKPKPPYNLPV